jgi:hypothetical protein
LLAKAGSYKSEWRKGIAVACQPLESKNLTSCIAPIDSGFFVDSDASILLLGQMGIAGVQVR